MMDPFFKAANISGPPNCFSMDKSDELRSVTDGVFAQCNDTDNTNIF